MKILIRGAGDIATGIALRLYRAGMQVVMTDLPAPTAIRRTVCFSQAIILGEMTVEDVTARRAETPGQAEALLAAGADPGAGGPGLHLPHPPAAGCPGGRHSGQAQPGHQNRPMRPLVVGVGPGFTAGEDCHAVVETMRGHTLGRVIYRGSALPNTSIPGLIGGYAGERVLRAPADGIFCQKLEIGAVVRAGDVAGEVAGQPMKCTIDGVLRGILADGTPVFRGMKAGDVDPRCKPEYCTTASDKALAVGGGVLEAVLHLHHQHPKTRK